MAACLSTEILSQIEKKRHTCCPWKTIGPVDAHTLSLNKNIRRDKARAGPDHDGRNRPWLHLTASSKKALTDLARIIHDGSSRNAAAARDKREEQTRVTC